ncbi:Fis family transcriptional regulator [Geodermatophilus sp. YIM 151500]|uniref:helix-turn-helix domain-containing protein n=1 Tax=Geodermatophilus sp. YIM 151500 TaxID=2984531 RepID=UPI0021E47CAB|nr:helix-turn-helix domain-containing protein [Geodermatophilus sp. YIM 151500]MCV2489898.1 Fis family transcriptional regulator [Geodermatophilus sp. YIM 151500]
MDPAPAAPAAPSAPLPDPELEARDAAPRLRASWRRSARYGVPPDEVLPVFTGSVDTGSLLYECAHEVLTGLHRTITNEPVSLMVADRDGLVLARLGDDRDIRRSLDQVHLAPGFFYSERTAGTNGLGLSLADRAPSLVRASEHYCTVLRGYTCAAVPVLDPVDGDLAGTINFTTWSDSSPDLLLALAQAAAGATSALMLARSTGRPVRPVPRGEVFHVVGGPLAPGHGDPCVSAGWRRAVAAAEAATAAGRVLVVVGEPGAGKAALASLARRRLARRERILHARAPEPADVAAWLELWTPALRDADSCVVVSGVERLPAWVAEELAATLGGVRRGDGRPQPFVLTAPDLAAVPASMAALVDAVVEVPPLRRRADDVLPLARAVAREERHREVAFTPRAAQVLENCSWPGNVRQLRRVVRDAVSRTDVVDVAHLAPEVLDGGTRPLTRLERLERDEIARALMAPGATATRAAEELGIGRATLYRKIAHYGLALPPRSPDPGA